MPELDHDAMERVFSEIEFDKEPFSCTGGLRAGSEEYLGEIPLGLRVVEKQFGVDRIPTWIPELDDVLGGGFVRGGVTILYGPRGAGKTSLLIQAASASLSSFVSAEESWEAITSLAKRVKSYSPWISFWAMNELNAMFRIVKRPLLIIDSIHTMYDKRYPGDIGSYGMVDAVMNQLVLFARDTGIAVVVIAYVNKNGSLDRPVEKVSHLADTVVMFEIVDPLLDGLRMLSTDKGGVPKARRVVELTAEGFRTPQKFQQVARFLARD